MPAKESNKQRRYYDANATCFEFRKLNKNVKFKQIRIEKTNPLCQRVYEEICLGIFYSRRCQLANDDRLRGEHGHCHGYDHDDLNLESCHHENDHDDSNENVHGNHRLHASDHDQRLHD